MATEAELQDAMRRVDALPKQPTNVQLKLYGLYKQATRGDVSGKRPGALDLRGRAKYDAWAERKGMTQEQARAAYVALASELGA